MLVKSDANDWSRRMQMSGQMQCNCPPYLREPSGEIWLQLEVAMARARWHTAPAQKTGQQEKGGNV